MKENYKFYIKNKDRKSEKQQWLAKSISNMTNSDYIHSSRTTFDKLVESTKSLKDKESCENPSCKHQLEELNNKVLYLNEMLLKLQFKYRSQSDILQLADKSSTESDDFPEKQLNRQFKNNAKKQLNKDILCKSMNDLQNLNVEKSTDDENGFRTNKFYSKEVCKKSNECKRAATMTSSSLEESSSSSLSEENQYTNQKRKRFRTSSSPQMNGDNLPEINSLNSISVDTPSDQLTPQMQAQKQLYLSNLRAADNYSYLQIFNKKRMELETIL